MVSTPVFLSPDLRLPSFILTSLLTLKLRVSAELLSGFLFFFLHLLRSDIFSSVLINSERKRFEDMNKRTFIVAMAIEIPMAFIVLTLLLNGRSDIIFYIAWALFAVAISSIFIFLKKTKDENKKEKLRKKIARSMLFAILGGAAVIICVVVAFVLIYSFEIGIN